MPLLPDDFAESFYQSAPQDQQASGYLRGGEEVRLTNLTSSGSLHFKLPRIHLGFLTHIPGEDCSTPARIHTVAIEPDLMRISLVWHMALPCHRTAHALQHTTIFLKRILTG